MELPHQTQYSRTLTENIKANNTRVLSSLFIQEGNGKGIFHGLAHLHIFEMHSVL